jgi:uncharacterized DUF497 family protein
MFGKQPQAISVMASDVNESCTKVCTIKGVDFEWDIRKAQANFLKHGVRFPEAVAVLEDPLAITIVDTESDDFDDRFVTLGLDALARVLVVVYTVRREAIRIISARPAEPHERKQYEEQL